MRQKANDRHHHDLIRNEVVDSGAIIYQWKCTKCPYTDSYDMSVFDPSARQEAAADRKRKEGTS